MKKILILILSLMMLLTSCGSDKNNGETKNESSPTLGDENGDGMVEDTQNDETGAVERMMQGMTDSSSSDSGSFKPVENVNSADDAVNFIAANLYSQCGEVLPIMMQTKVLETKELDSISYNLGLSDTSGIEDMILSCSAIDSFDYSLLLIRTDGADTESLQEAINNSESLKNEEMSDAESICTIRLDDDIIILSGDSDQVEKVSTAISSCAETAYENIGQVVKVR